uniref:Focadhesin n=1 Tax=Hippocampus comes TaxID=109280 RepID=A0A3Q3DDJ6_HIPCM
CWTAILAAIAEFVQQAPAYVAMLVPFLRYLYCQPERRSEHGFLRQGLLRTLLPDEDSPAFDSLLRCLCRLVPHMPVSKSKVDCVETVLELHWMIGALLPSLSVKRREPWRSERLRHLLQLLCVSRRDSYVSSAFVCPGCGYEDELLMGVALLLFEAPAAQQSSLLSLGKKKKKKKLTEKWYPRLNTHSCSMYAYSISANKRILYTLICRQSINTLFFVPSLLPVLLFKLGKEKDPSLTHAVLDCLPNLGTHKVLLCVPTILQTLGTLASSLKLKAVAMRLTAALWKKEDRVYPELQRLLAQPDNRVVMGRETQWEQVLARAACLRDICRERPYQHASDMLAAIALTLKQCSRDDQVTPAVLALQGLQELCRAEVVDIVSTWKSLGPELRCDSRPPMVKAVSQLLALVPQLAVKSEEYQVPAKVMHACK